MREKLLRLLAEQAYRHPWRILAAALAVTVASLVIGRNLQLSMRWADLMPESDPRTIEFNRVLEKYRSASSIQIVLQGDEKEIKALADDVAGPIANVTMKLKDGSEEKLIKRVIVKVDEEFIRRHGLMLMKTRDLENSKDLFSDVSLKPLLTHINDNLEKTYIYSSEEEPLTSREKSDNAIHYLDGLKYWLGTMETYYNREDVPAEKAIEASDRLLIGDTYFLSYDHRTLLMIAQPTFPVTDYERGAIACDSIRAILSQAEQQHRGVRTGVTGMVAMARDEMAAIEGTMNLVAAMALLLILTLFIVSFRMWVAPLFAVLVLIVGVIWTLAFATLAVGTLNIMTSMFGVILIGLGIDFSVHIISGFAERRGQGMGIFESTEETLLKAGPGITTGGLTTGIAFLTLTISDSRGLSDLGLIAGAGVILCMIAAFILLPPLLVIRERRREKKARRTAFRPAEYRFLGTGAELLAKGRWGVLVLMILLTGFFIYQSSRLQFDYDMLNVEPKGMPSVTWYDTLLAAFDMSPEYALVTSSSLDSIRVIVKRAKDFSNLAWVDAITEYIPTSEEQAERADIITGIRRELENHQKPAKITPSDFSEITDQLDRLWMNIAEMSDLAFQAGQDRLEQKTYELIANLDQPKSRDYIKSMIRRLQEDQGQAVAGLNHFQRDYFDHFRRTALKMANPQPITLENLPSTIFDRYASDDGQTFLVSIFPTQDLWNMENLKAFDRQLKSISPRATGTPPLFLAMIEIIGADGRRATGLALITILVLLFLDFHNLRLTLLAMIPLITGTIWMSGVMHLVGMKLNVNNLAAIPLILGIGIDYGVHLIHRFRAEGPGKVKLIFSSTGKAIMLSALTTMIGFGSLNFLNHPGMASMGLLLFIGVGTCLLTSFGLLAPIFALLKKP